MNSNNTGKDSTDNQLTLGTDVPNSCTKAYGKTLGNKQKRRHFQQYLTDSESASQRFNQKCVEHRARRLTQKGKENGPTQKCQGNGDDRHQILGDH